MVVLLVSPITHTHPILQLDPKSSFHYCMDSLLLSLKNRQATSQTRTNNGDESIIPQNTTTHGNESTTSQNTTACESHRENEGTDTGNDYKNNEENRTKPQQTTQQHLTKMDNSYSIITPPSPHDTQPCSLLSDNTENSLCNPDDMTQLSASLSDNIDEIYSQLNWDGYFNNETQEHLNSY